MFIAIDYTSIEAQYCTSSVPTRKGRPSTNNMRTWAPISAMSVDRAMKRGVDRAGSSRAASELTKGQSYWSNSFKCNDSPKCQCDPPGKNDK